MKKAFELLTVVFMFAGALAADTLITRDGFEHLGTVVAVTPTRVTFREAGILHRYARSSVRTINFSVSGPGAASPRSGAALPQSSEPIPGPRRGFTVPAGTEIMVMPNQSISSRSARENQVFSADVAENVTNASGQIVIPKGSEADLVIRRVGTGNITGGSDLALDLQSVRVGGRRYIVNTEPLVEKGTQGIGANRRTAETVGGGAALGTLIGAIAGGGKGAAIGAAGGAAAGVGAEILTKGKSVQVPAESKLRFRLDQPLRLQAAY